MILKNILICTVFVLLQVAASGQVLIHGTVYERSARYGMSGVSVMSNSGTGAVTDSLGHYSIKLAITDSLSFSYQGKATQKFPVKEIPFNRAFDISMHVDIKVLQTVEIRQNSYRVDSMLNREEYRKVFEFSPEYMTAVNGGAGVNLDALLSMRKIKRMEAFREKLVKIEQDKYIDHRFNASLVKKITGLKPPALDTFMLEYRPTYEMLQSFETEYQYLEYIKENSAYFYYNWKKEHPVQP
jgi:hypothetical protein